MPPNYKGGKNYKKTAKGGETNAILMIERQPDQQIARVIRVLGNRNMMCYCNDNKTRICHVRGKLRNRVYVEQGDIVLISLRDFEGSSEDERGDILAKYPYETLSKLKKEAGVNPKLFMQIEGMDGAKVAAIGLTGNTIEDDIEFDREGEAAESSSESEDLDVDDI